MKIFAEKYKLHLLPIPRDDISICDIYISNERGVTSTGNLVDFLEPPYQIPPIQTGSMADISGQLSKNVSIDIGIGLLEGFLSAFGIQNIIQKVRIGYENKGAHYLKFRFSNIQRQSVSVVKAATNLINHVIPENHPLYDPKNKYYLVTAMIRTSSISIIAEDGNHQDIDIGLDVIGIAELSSSVSITKSSNNEMTYIGKNILVFGVEVHELNYSEKNRSFKMNAMNKFVGLRGQEEDVRRPAIIGDSKQGNLFLSPKST